jgi:putative ABC transport system ATP-binding protein
LPQPIIAFDNLHLTLGSRAGQVNILRGIDLEIAPGEAIGLIGPSGSGKSSMLMMMAGLERPSSGRILVAGQDLGAMDEDALARFRRDTTGIVFQSFHLVPTMTALENVAVPLELAGRRDAFDRAARELAAVGLSDRAGHYPGQLSGGEQQRVALARAVAGNPQILLADEPTGNLDQATGAQIISLMFALRERSGATLMLITHDPALAGLCDRVVHLRDGKIDRITPGAATGKPDVIAQPRAQTGTGN